MRTFVHTNGCVSLLWTQNQSRHVRSQSGVSRMIFHLNEVYVCMMSWFVCMMSWYVCVYTCMYVGWDDVCACVVRWCLYMYIFAYVYVCRWDDVWVCMVRWCLYMYICVYVYVCRWDDANVSMYDEMICMHVYVYIYIYMMT